MKASKRGRSKEDWVSVLTIRDPGKHTFEAILLNVSKEALVNELRGKLQKGSVLCTDGFQAYVAIALPNDLSYKRLNVSEVIDKVFHIQNVNAHHGCLKG